MTQTVKKYFTSVSRIRRFVNLSNMNLLTVLVTKLELVLNIFDLVTKRRIVTQTVKNCCKRCVNSFFTVCVHSPIRDLYTRNMLIQLLLVKQIH